MKKVFFVAAAFIVLAATSCKNEPRVAQVADTTTRDSLQKIIDQKDNEINDMMSTLNQIQEGFREIAQAENRVNIVKDGERTDKAQQIRENMQFISQRMQQNKQLINKLQQQLRESSFKGDELKKTIETLTAQLEEKEQQLQQLRVELDSKDIHISQLDETINNLNTNVSSLQEESSQKTEVINTQDRQLNTAWYVFGTKSELKEQGILVKGRVLQGNFNKSYFTKIDIRVVNEIKLYSKWAKLLTMHPGSSYTLNRDSKDQYVLRITNPQTFWSTSKYLVVQVK